MHSPAYRGRFAPSPTGPLHFGSLVAAVGSYLDAKHHNGVWLVRMEDLDAPRCVPGAEDDILRTLEAFGLHWDSDAGRTAPANLSGTARPAVLHQSQRTAAYDEALHKLQSLGAVYPCRCTRKEIADSALHGIDGPVYPGACRNGIPEGREGRAWRVRTDCFPPPAEFDDALQGHIVQHLEHEVGDFVVKRADGLYAYQLAVVVDDAFQNITHVVRGADLLASTPRQIHLQRLLGLPTPHYLHLPVALNAQGEKLSKQTLAQPVDSDNRVATLHAVLQFLRQQPPPEMRQGSLASLLNWAIAHWRPSAMFGYAGGQPPSQFV